MPVSVDEAELPSLDEFDLLLEDKAFVDHFNVFLSLPVFGQQAIYSFREKEFEFDPPIRRRRYFIHRRSVINWLREERFPYFRKTRLYAEYLLCTRLREVGFHVQDAHGKDQPETPEVTRVFTVNLLSHMVGTQLFRQSMSGTNGERVYNCWLDIEILKRTTDPIRRRRQFQRINRLYIADGGPQDLNGNKKNLALYGKLNFEILDKNITELIGTLSRLPFSDDVFSIDAEDALVALQGHLLELLKGYWVPRHVLHVLNTTSVEVLKPLFSRCEGEDLSFDEVDRMVRCRRMFPKFVLAQPEGVPTEVFASVTEKDDPRLPPPSPDFSEPREVKPEDLLMLWGGAPIKPPEETTTEVESYSVSRPWSAVSWADDDDGNGTVTPDSPCREWTSPSRGDDFDNSTRTPSGSSVSNLLRETSSIEMSDNSLSRMVLSSITPKKLGNMSLLLKTYVLGRRDHRTNPPRVSNRILCALVSDNLAGFPFLQFLQRKNLILDINYLNFWEDVRSYLRTDDKLDSHGNSSRKVMARKLAERYLLSSDDEAIFSEGLKMALLDTLSRGDDESLLFSAHDIVSSSLNISWKKYAKIDRRKFVRAACGKRFMLFVNSLQSPVPRVRVPTGDTDPLYFADARQRVQGKVDSECSSDSSSPLPPYDNVYVKPLGEEHRTKALEQTVISSVDGYTMNPTCTVADLVYTVNSNFGSLDLGPADIVRQDHLRRLLHPGKINISTIQVSKKVLLPKISISTSDNVHTGPRGNRLVIRRNGVILNMPFKPRSFLEVLTNSNHYEFFKRFLAARKVTVPLQFWRAVEDLKETGNYKARQMKTNHIFRRFFGKQAKYGLNLDCTDEVIKQIPYMENVTAGMMVCAQASIFRMMERKWFPGYLETFPIDSELRESAPSMIEVSQQDISPLMMEWKPRKKPQRKTFHLWLGFVSVIRDFMRSMRNQIEVQLFEIYLKRELDRLSSAEKLMETREVNPRGRDLNFDSPLSTMTRVVLRNKVVVINKLPRDLQFWQEVNLFRQQVDSVVQSGCYTKEDNDTLLEKVEAIVTCFLASDVPPRVQVNIPNDLAASITASIAIAGPQRGLFHEACVLLFPILYHFWKKFSVEWLEKVDAHEMLRRIEEEEMREEYSSPHHGHATKIDYTKATVKDYKIQAHDDESMRIHFSISHGIRVMIPKPKGHFRPERKFEDESAIGDASVSPPKLGQFPSHHSGRNIPTETSKRRSSIRDTGSIGKEKDGSRSSAERESPRVDVGKMKARRLSLLVESLNVQHGQPTSTSPPRGSRFGRPMKTILDVVNVARTLGPDEQESFL
ncbi:regulator of G-protein signaling protein-like [Haliotis asinina]|uniref:regulator of G-protein signaling protein-like n=1 Tax=Haliotis asinina TaxID=109174 RepID=UPI003531AD8A